MKITFRMDGIAIMTLLEKEFYTEREAIELLMEHGYSDGSEFETSIWKSRKCLKENHATHVAVLRKLACICEEVSYEGKGQKRKYFLIGLREEFIADEGGNNGRRPTDYDLLIDEYVFNQLVSNSNSFPRSYRGWAKTLKLPSVFGLHVDKTYEILRSLHADTSDSYNASEIIDEFIGTMSKRNSDIIEKAFNRLQKANRVKVTKVYNFLGTDGKYKIVTFEEYREVEEEFKSFLEETEITMFQYNKMKDKKFKNEYVSEIINNAKKILALWDVDFYFISFSVDVLDSTVKTNVSYKDCINAYYCRLIELTEQRQERYERVEKTYFTKKYYLLNTLAMLKFIGIEGLDEKIQTELNKVPKRIEFNKGLSNLF